MVRVERREETRRGEKMMDKAQGIGLVCLQKGQSEILCRYEVIVQDQEL